MYADDLVLYSELGEDLRAMGYVCCRRGLKDNPDKSKVMILNGEYGLEC